MEFFDKNGKMIPSSRIIKNFFAAKGKNRCYVVCDKNGNIINPNECNNAREEKLFKCNEKCYNAYIKYLKTKKKVFLNEAQRRIFDESK